MREYTDSVMSLATATKPKKRNYTINGVPASKTSEYVAWSNMIQRCSNPKHKEYKNYGERGIEVCEEWQSVGGFINFVEYVGAKPDKALTLERLDSNGNYEPGNVMWANTQVQALNKRMRCDNTSGYRGTFYDKDKKKWYARIHVGGTYAWLGYYKTPEEAALAYDAASVQVFGRLGKLNLLGANDAC